MSRAVPILTPGRRLPLATSRSISGFTLGGSLLLTLFTAVCLFAPLIAAYDPDAYATTPLAPPSPAHLLGANSVGQDVLSQLLWGTRASLAVAVLVGGLSVLLALFVGILAGATGGVADGALMRFVDLVLALPQLPLLVVLAVFLEPGIASVVVLLTVLSWPRPARIIRSQVLSLRSRGYVQSARLYGGGWLYVMRRHLMPAVAPIAIASLVTLAGRAVLMEASLAFLGIGDPTLHSWGMMIHDALGYRGLFLTSAWLWWVLPPGICLSLLILAFTMLGTAVEGYSNARLARHHGG